MELLFLGTGAADWDLFSGEDPSLKRRYSSLLIDEEILIDAGPQVIDALNTFKVNPQKIKCVLTTHKHFDHFNKNSLDFLIENGAVAVEINEGESVTFGKYKITALRGNHSIPALHFIIFDGEKRLFYGLDGAWLLYDEIAAIKENGVDCAVLDGTIGFIEGDYRIFEHNNLNMIIEMQKSLKEHVKSFYVSHLAYTLHPSHEDVVNSLKPYGIGVAKDGMKLII